MRVWLCGGIFALVVALLAFAIGQSNVFNATTIYHPLPKGVAAGAADTAVVIIGGSFSGLTLASELGLHGYKVIVVSPKKHGENAKKLTGGCSFRGPALAQMAQASNITTEAFTSILANGKEQAHIEDLSFGTAQAYITNHTAFIDETKVQLVPLSPKGISVRHNDGLKRFREYLEKRGDVQFLDQSFSNIEEIEPLLEGYKKRIIINATPNVRLLSHPLPPPSPTSFVLSAQSPCKAKKDALLKKGQGLFAFVELSEEQKMYSFAATGFLDDEYPESNSYVLVNHPVAAPANEAQKKNITALLKSIANGMGMEVVDEENALFVGSAPVTWGGYDVETYFHKSADNSTAYLTTGIAGAYGAPAINGDGILGQSTASRIISRAIIDGQIFAPNGGEFLQNSLKTGLAGLQARNSATHDAFSNSLAIHRGIMNYGRNLFYYVLRMDQ